MALLQPWKREHIHCRCASVYYLGAQCISLGRGSYVLGTHDRIHTGPTGQHFSKSTVECASTNCTKFMNCHGGPWVGLARRSCFSVCIVAACQRSIAMCTCIGRAVTSSRQQHRLTTFWALVSGIAAHPRSTVNSRSWTCSSAGRRCVEYLPLRVACIRRAWHPLAMKSDFEGGGVPVSIKLPDVLCMPNTVCMCVWALAHGILHARSSQKALKQRPQ